MLQNKRAILRTKDCRIDNASPMDKNAHSNEELYSVPCASAINPISIPAVLPMPTINYDIPFHHNTSYAATSSFPQPLYGTQTATFPVQEIYPASTQNVVMPNGAQYFPPHSKFSTLNNQNLDIIKRSSWDVVSIENNYKIDQLTTNCWFTSFIYYFFALIVDIFCKYFLTHFPDIFR